MARKFLVVADDTPEFAAALSYASRRARATGGRVALLRVIAPAAYQHWSGVREEIEREQRAEAEALLTRHAAIAHERSGQIPVLLIEQGDPEAAIRKAVAEDPEIKILVLAASAGGRGPGPLVSAMLKGGLSTGRPLPVTVVPGDLSDQAIEDLA